MSLLNALLLVLLMGSSMLLVHTSHEARQLFSAVDRAQREQKQLDAEYRRLDAERQTQATHQKVERVARQRLQMQPPALTVYVDAPAGSARRQGPNAPDAPGLSGAPVLATARADAVRP
jgi:cell division protein FtsL